MHGGRPRQKNHEEQKENTVKIILVAITALTLAAANLNAADKPNVILVMTDDVGYGDLACHGNPFVKTPNLDQLYCAKRAADRFSCFAEVFADAGVAPDGAALPACRRAQYQQHAEPARDRSPHAGEPVCRERLSDRHLRQMAPGRSLPVSARRIAVSRKWWSMATVR